MRKDFGTKSWFYPLPVLIIATYDEQGKADAMNAAWGGLYDADKVVLCLSAGHKTTKNIMARKAFTVSFADAAHVIPADYVGMVSANDEPDKLDETNDDRGAVPFAVRMPERTGGYTARIANRRCTGTAGGRAGPGRRERDHSLQLSAARGLS